MRVEVMQHYGIKIPFNQAGYYETEHHAQLLNNIRGAILQGRLIALCGVIGCGKTVTALSVTRLIDFKGGRIATGEVRLAGRNLVPLSQRREMPRATLGRENV